LENGIQVTGVKPVPKIAPTKPAGGGANAVASAPAYEDLDIQVQGVGKYANVRRFIAALNAFPKIVAARTVDLEPKSMPGQEWSDVLDVTVDLRAYVFPTKTDDSANSLSPTPTPSPGSLQVTAGPVPASGSTSSNPPFVTTQQIGTAAQIQSHKAAGSVRVPFAGPRPVRQGSPFASPSQPVKNAALGGSTR
jgi:hypothetical protein